MPENDPTTEEKKYQNGLRRIKIADLNKKDNQNPNNQNLESELPDKVEDEKETSRELGRKRKQDKDSLKQKMAKIQSVKEKAEKLKSMQQKLKHLKNVYRAINGASAITLVGLIITFLVMNAQLIFGNFFKFKFVPKLDWWELIIIGFADILILFVLFFIAILIYFIVHPCEVTDVIGTWWADFVGSACGVITGTGI